MIVEVLNKKVDRKLNFQLDLDWACSKAYKGLNREKNGFNERDMVLIRRV